MRTWIGVCPRTSFNFVSLTAWPSSKSSSRIFRTSACLPVTTIYDGHTMWKQPSMLTHAGVDKSNKGICNMKSSQGPEHGSLPACRLTPAASYMTIKLKARLTANKELPSPNSIAIAVVTACKGITASCWALQVKAKGTTCLRADAAHGLRSYRTQR